MASNDILDAQEFFKLCIMDFHARAGQEDYATKGLIFIPELMPMGQQSVLAFLNDSFFKMQFGSNPQTYYYVIMSLCVQTGIVYAAKWHEDFSELKNGYVDKIIAEGPAEEAQPITKKQFGWDRDKENAFYNMIYQRWLSLHEPYWDLDNPREYTFNAMVAAYQLGVSMILEKLGY